MKGFKNIQYASFGYYAFTYCGTSFDLNTSIYFDTSFEYNTSI